VNYAEKWPIKHFIEYIQASSKRPPQSSMMICMLTPDGWAATGKMSPPSSIKCNRPPIKKAWCTSFTISCYYCTMTTLF